MKTEYYNIIADRFGTIAETTDFVCSVLPEEHFSPWIYDSEFGRLNGAITNKGRNEMFAEMAAESDELLFAIESGRFQTTDRFWVFGLFDLEPFSENEDGIYTTLFDSIDYAEQNGYITENDIKEALGL